MPKPKPPRPSRIPKGLPDKDTLLKYIRDSGETDKAAIAKAFALKGEARARYLIPISDTRRDDAWAAAHPDLYAQFVAMGARRQLEARAAHDTWDRLPQIACPVMIAAGRYDGIALPAAQEKMAARIPGAKLQVFEGGHLFIIQDRTAAPAMAAFLTES